MINCYLTLGIIGGVIIYCGGGTLAAMWLDYYFDSKPKANLMVKLFLGIFSIPLMLFVMILWIPVEIAGNRNKIKRLEGKLNRVKRRRKRSARS